MDYRNTPDLSDQITFIYGHHLRSGQKFSALMNYRNQSFYDRNSSYLIFTPEGNFEIKIFASYIIDTRRETPYFRLGGEEHFNTEIDAMIRRSFIKSDTRPVFGDRLVFLSTCTNVRQTERMLVAGIVINVI
jgi:sortase B